MKEMKGSQPKVFSIDVSTMHAKERGSARDTTRVLAAWLLTRAYTDQVNTSATCAATA